MGECAGATPLCCKARNGNELEFVCVADQASCDAAVARAGTEPAPGRGKAEEDAEDDEPTYFPTYIPTSFTYYPTWSPTEIPTLAK